MRKRPYFFARPVILFHFVLYSLSPYNLRHITYLESRSMRQIFSRTVYAFRRTDDTIT